MSISDIEDLEDLYDPMCYTDTSKGTNIVLSEGDMNLFLEMLDKPSEPNQYLKDLAKRYHEKYKD